MKIDKTIKHNKTNVIALMGIIGLMWNCTNRSIEPKSTCSAVEKDTVSFSKDIQPILNQHCTISACHAGNTPKGNLNLESSMSYLQLTNTRRGYLNISLPKNSLFYGQLLSSSASPMPPSYRLDNCNLQTIEKWISQQAKNN